MGENKNEKKKSGLFILVRRGVLHMTMLRSVFGYKSEEVTGEWRKLHNEEAHDLYALPDNIKSRDSSVGIALHYGLDDRGSRFRFPAGAGNLSLHHRVQNGSGAHPAS
jgi:hypothetical protein